MKHDILVFLSRCFVLLRRIDLFLRPVELCSGHGEGHLLNGVISHGLVEMLLPFLLTLMKKQTWQSVFALLHSLIFLCFFFTSVAYFCSTY